MGARVSGGACGCAGAGVRQACLQRVLWMLACAWVAEPHKPTALQRGLAAAAASQGSSRQAPAATPEAAVQEGGCMVGKLPCLLVLPKAASAGHLQPACLTLPAPTKPPANRRMHGMHAIAGAQGHSTHVPARHGPQPL